jgi:elongation factor Ts
MSAISAGLVKELREKTGAGMMDCKKALQETSSDLEAAIDWLRAKGLSKAAKKADRVTAEGLVAVAVNGNKAAILEVNSETDFVARNNGFQKMVLEFVKSAVNSGTDIDDLKQSKISSGETVETHLTSMIASIGENMNLRRVQQVAVEDGVIGSYVHNQVADNLGKIGVLVALESKGDKAVLSGYAKQIAMHIAAASPLALNSDLLGDDLKKREANVLEEKARESGKPENIIEKIVQSGLQSYYKEVCLLEQAYVMDSSKTISSVLKEIEKEVGSPVVLKGYARFLLGDGIEKQEADFAAEVAAVVNG